MRFIPSRRTVLKTVIAVGIVALFSSGVGYWWIWSYCVATPPAVPENPPIMTAEITISEDGTRHLGDSFLRGADGIMRMKVVGDPYTRGVTIGRLSEEYIEAQEADFLENLSEHVPSKMAQWLLKVFITVRNKDLPKFIDIDHQLEIAGYVNSYEDRFAHIGPIYHRKLNYHAAHDIGHAVIDNPLVGCTSFAAWDDFTADGHLIMGRTFDFDIARSFDLNKIVYYVQPEKGHDFIYVAWPGMIGVVSGINDQKIAVTINAGHSDDTRTIGTPVALVVREVMQHSATLEDAIERIKKSTMFVNESFLIADGKTGTAVVVEKTPTRCEVRNPENSHIIAANHFLMPAFQNDTEHKEYIEQGTSTIRFARTKELLDQSKGHLSPKTAMNILRDRMVPGIDEPVMGNPAAINMLIATHAVVFDVTDGVIWVSASPHQLGKFIPFGFDDFENPAGKRIMDADPLIMDGSYTNFTRSLDLLEEGDELLKKKEYEEAMKKCDEANALNPNNYYTSFLQTRIAIEQKKWTDADGFAKKTQSWHIAYQNEREEMEALIKTIQKNIERSE